MGDVSAVVGNELQWYITHLVAMVDSESGRSQTESTAPGVATETLA